MNILDTLSLGVLQMIDRKLGSLENKLPNKDNIINLLELISSMNSFKYILYSYDNPHLVHNANNTSYATLCTFSTTIPITLTSAPKSVIYKLNYVISDSNSDRYGTLKFSFATGNNPSTWNQILTITEHAADQVTDFLYLPIDPSRYTTDNTFNLKVEYKVEGNYSIYRLGLLNWGALEIYV